MMRKITVFYLLVLVFFIQVKSFAEEVTLVYTGSTHAMLYPCHCPLEPDGGVARRATLVKELRKTNPNMLLLDSGNFFGGGLLDENTKNIQFDMQRTTVNLRAMELMKYDAINIGEDEFNFGVDFFGENAGKVKLRFISANLKHKKILPYIIKELTGVKIGIIGLTNYRVKDKVKDLDVIEPKPALKASIAELKAKGVDLIILLSNLGEEADIKLTGEVPGVDVIIDSQVGSKRRVSFKAGGKIFLIPLWQGRRIGKAVLDIKDKKIVNYKAEEIRVSDKLSDAPEVLKILPKCFSDTDCRKKGFRGECKEAGTSGASCLFKEIEKIHLTIILPKDCSVCNTKPTVELLKRRFENLDIKYLYYPEKNAVNLVKKLDISGLPAFIIKKDAEKAEGFGSLRDILKEKGEYYLVKPEASGVSYFLNRKEKKEQFDVFLSLFDKNTPGVLEVIKDFNPVIHFLVVKDGDNFDAPHGTGEVEEDSRALCVKKYYPDLFGQYITCRSKNIGSAWWDDCLKGVDTEKIKACARGGEGASLLEENSKLSRDIKIMFGPTYLLNNKVIFSSNGAPSKEEIKKIIKKQ